MEKLGIENLKKPVGAVINLGVSIDQAMAEDSAGGKKITRSEALSIAFKTVPDIWSTWKNWGDIKDEYKDLDNAERTEMVAWAQAEFDLENDYVEAKIEAGLEAAAAVEKFFSIKKPDDAV